MLDTTNKHDPTKGHFLFMDGQKAVDLWGDDPAGWTSLTGATDTPEGDYYKFIPTLFRGVQLRAYAVATMPFQLMKGKTVYDSSADWANKVGFLPNPDIFLQLAESSLVLAGCSYFFRDRSRAATKRLRYHLPWSITPVINKETGELETFDRPVNGVTKHFKPEDYIYFWLPDPYVEVGPAKNYPAKAAANACGLLYNLDIFASGYAKRGLIKAMLLMVKGMPNESERSKLEDYWNRFIAGPKNWGRAKVFNADAVTPTIVGEGFKDLENVTIAQEKREDIAVAIGIPMSILFANAANYATSQQDELNFINKTVIPDCNFIQAVLNEQLFDPLGLRWEFLPESLPALQEDETSRAASLQQLVSAGLPLLMAMDILGYDLTDKQRAELEAAVKEKQERAEALAAQLAQKPEPEPEGEQEAEPEKPPAQEPTFQKQLAQYQRKAIRARRAGKSADVEFISDDIPASLLATIREKWAECDTEDEIKYVFNFTANENKDRTPEQILRAIELGVEALDKKGTP